MLPPISVPQPRKLPFIKSNAASPPVEPPGVYVGLIGLVVSPQTGLSVSHHYAVSKVRSQMFVVTRSYHYALWKIRLGNDDGS